MNELFAISPHAYDTADDATTLFRLFGPTAGRYVGELPGTWKRLFHERINALPELSKARAKRALVKAKNAFLPTGLPYDPGLTWLENIEAAGKCFHQTVVQRSQETSHPTIDDLDDLASVSVFEGRLTTALIASLCTPLLKISHEAAILDPYFGRKKESEVVLSELLKVAKIGKTQTLHIWFRTGLNYVDEREARLRFQQAKDRAKFLGKVIAHSVVSDRGSTTFHDRYLVSDKGGIAFPKGLQSSGKNEVFVKPIGDSEHLRLRTEFISGDNDLEISAHWEAN